MPPKVGSMAFTVFTKSSTDLQFNSISNTSISAKILNNTPFPSITGLDASGPISPNPNTAVPFEITATKFPLAVYLYTSSTFSAIFKHGSATPGEYANAKSNWVCVGLVETTSILPGLPSAW